MDYEYRSQTQTFAVTSPKLFFYSNAEDEANGKKLTLRQS